jgi:excisionase family DNA binding protein
MTMDASTLPTLVDIPTLAEHLGVNPRHVRRLVAEHRIPFVRIGYFIRFEVVAINRWVEEAKIDEGSPIAPRRARRRSSQRPLSASSA